MIPRFHSSTILRTASILCLAMAVCEARADERFAPDTVIFKDGTVSKGLIVRNGIDSITLQEEYQEKVYPKRLIRRIRDEAYTGSYFSGMNRKGSLPPWRAIANDLRTDDFVRSLREIPATVIHEGPFRNVPYIAFRVNTNLELNIFGDPDDPAGLEFGIYGAPANSGELRKRLRAFLAGYLFLRDEIAALYSMNLDGDIKTAGDVMLIITPPSPAKQIWWISVHNPHRIKNARLSDAEYAKLTVPANVVFDANGNAYSDPWKRIQQSRSHREQRTVPRVFLKGFSRDENGNFAIPPEN
jgi:hypothetical protein